MRAYTIDQLAQFPEEKALQKHFDRLNYRWLRWVWRVSFVAAFVAFTAKAVDGDLARLGAATLWLALLFAMYFFREHAWYEERFTEILVGFLLFGYGSGIVLSSEHEFRLVFSAAMMPLLYVLFRLPARIYVMLSSIFAATAATLGIMGKGAKGFEPGESIFVPIFTNALFIGIALYINRQARNSFLEEWRVLASRERERERMRGELADARKIQLAMLPAAPPALDWLEIASVSLPASEVGGDFFDYFTLDDGRLVIAIGDVAGHGVSSGLVLAGIKSGLHLLRDELVRPVETMTRLNRLASEWLQWRMLVTLLIAIIDPKSMRLRVVSAGHPPLMLVSSANGVRCVGHPSLPLGTKLAAQWNEDECELAAGDLLLLYTDGVTELANAAGEGYGDERLRAVAAQAAGENDRSEEIRSLILSDLSRHKDQSHQADDLSFVVARVRGGQPRG